MLALSPTPPANAFVPAARRHEPQPAYPLDVFFCNHCAHVQLLDVIDPAVLFEEYVYVSGTSPVFVDHFRRYAADVVRRYAVAPGALVVEIGSNDGTLLRFFQDAGMRVLGVDPAKEIAARATKSGIETKAAFFTEALSADIRREHGPAAVVTANNVLAHADDLAGICRGVAALLGPGGVLVFEVSYLVDVYTKTLFDTIYHEHLAYHAVKPLEPFLEANGLELIEALRVDSHGGSLRGIAQPRGGPHPRGRSVAELVALEEELGLDKPDTLRAFAARIDALKERTVTLLRDLKRQGKRIAAFGAPAKATTLMHHFEMGPDLVEFIVDDSPLKQGLFSPGYHIPVLPSSAVYERKPDYLLVLAWNFAGPIMEKHRAFREAGGHFIVPVPTLEVR